MASIVMEATVHASADTVWSALSDFGAAHRVFDGVLSDCRLEGDGKRVVTFSNGRAVTERIVGIDPERRRIAYAVIDGGFEHHCASMQVEDLEDGACRFVWSTDVLPDLAVERIRPLMNAGVAALRKTFEQG